MKYKVHRVTMKMTSDQGKLEEFLNGLTGEVVAIVPNVSLAIPCQARGSGGLGRLRSGVRRRRGR